MNIEEMLIFDKDRKTLSRIKQTEQLGQRRNVYAYKKRKKGGRKNEKEEERRREKKGNMSKPLRIKNR